MNYTLLVMMAMALVPLPCSGSEQAPKYEELHEPRRAMPRPPRNPVVFQTANKMEQQSLEISFLDSKTFSFRLDKSGICKRHEKGIAKIMPYWWLGAESEENEAGEEIGVTQYLYEKDSKCTFYLRIDDGDWLQATVSEAGKCSKSCPISSQRMHLKPSKRKR